MQDTPRGEHLDKSEVQIVCCPYSDITSTPATGSRWRGHLRGLSYHRGSRLRQLLGDSWCKALVVAWNVRRILEMRPPLGYSSSPFAGNARDVSRVLEPQEPCYNPSRVVIVVYDAWAVV